MQIFWPYCTNTATYIENLCFLCTIFRLIIGYPIVFRNSIQLNSTLALKLLIAMSRVILILFVFCLLSVQGKTEDPIKGPLADSFQYFEDEDQSVIYIDFADIPQDVKEVVIIDGTDKEVKRVEVKGQPDDTIFELDYANYKNGTYKVELVTGEQTLSRFISFK